MSNLIFNNKKNDFSNWERLGDDTMFDTTNIKLSENRYDFIPESVAEHFANNRGILKGIKEKVHIEEYVSLDFDGNGGFPRETSSIREIVLNSGITYAKENKTTYLSRHKITRHYGGRVVDTFEERVIISKNKSDNSSFYIQLGQTIIELGRELIKKH